MLVTCANPKVGSLPMSSCIFTSRTAVGGNRIGPVCVRVYVCLQFGDLLAVCVDPSCQKDFGAKELYNTSRGRCVNAQALSFIK